MHSFVAIGHRNLGVIGVTDRHVQTDREDFHRYKEKIHHTFVQSSSVAVSVNWAESQ